MCVYIYILLWKWNQTLYTFFFFVYRLNSKNKKITGWWSNEEKISFMFRSVEFKELSHKTITSKLSLFYICLHVRARERQRDRDIQRETGQGIGVGRKDKSIRKLGIALKIHLLWSHYPTLQINQNNLMYHHLWFFFHIRHLLSDNPEMICMAERSHCLEQISSE